VTGEDAAYAALLTKLERESGFHGSLYRQKCLRRRVAVRMRARGAADFGHYSTILDQDPEEYKRLLHTLTINVSKFFRNAETWTVIRDSVLPDLLGRRGPLVLWSAGSAAGEEAYSLAILIAELLGTRRMRRWDEIRIVGTDIDAPSLEAARAAVYADGALSETPCELRDHWFHRDDGWRLQESIRSRVQFEQVDILTGPPDFDVDLIICRNLLIYLDRPAQEEVFEIFAEVLKPGGYLILGRVETVAAEIRPLLDVVDARERVYKKR
jgi:chemotaxis methyl-accepting protein methylase